MKAPPVTAQELLGHDNFYNDEVTEGLNLHEAPIHIYRMRTRKGPQYVMVIGRPMNGHDINMTWYAAAPNKDHGLNTYDMLDDSKSVKHERRVRQIHEKDLGDAWETFGQHGYRMLGLIRAENYLKDGKLKGLNYYLYLFGLILMEKDDINFHRPTPKNTKLFWMSMLC